ncbi:hypothetical protein LTR16_007090 [Cryomyces antarcticus]|uniref:Uncharacterized protein n=1 Tax=Cryomyces antarcticus TaxID=329879 RepID=A0ABR0LVK5_9PEZI|nr:hypothetical protein LTR60_007724 [Cryomyces antarcticus]KAK5246244.1 hypothetical protein LTR16_007090 [Cryomyces antarcticus]
MPRNILSFEESSGAFSAAAVGVDRVGVDDPDTSTDRTEGAGEIGTEEAADAMGLAMEGTSACF